MMSFKDFKIPNYESSLIGNYTEQFDCYTLAYITLNGYIKDNGTSRKKYREGFKYESENAFCEAIINNVDFNNDGTLTVSYDNPMRWKNEDLNIGRVNPLQSLSVGSLRRDIRHLVCAEYYTDIDIKNCHPVIISQLCELNNMETPNLTKYVNNRDDILTNTMECFGVNRDNAKQLYIRLLYGGKYNTWLKDNKLTDKNCDIVSYIKNYEKEVNIIKERVWDANVDIQDKIISVVDKMDKKHKCPKRTLLSIYNQTIERMCLEQIVIELTEQGAIVNNDCVLCYDGVMIRKGRKFNLTKCEARVFINLDLSIELTVKEMNEQMTKPRIGMCAKVFNLLNRDVYTPTEFNEDKDDYDTRREWNQAKKKHDNNEMKKYNYSITKTRATQKAYVEKYISKMTNGSVCMDNGNGAVITYKSITGFISANKNYITKKLDKKTMEVIDKPYFDIWTTLPDCRTCYQIDFNPIPNYHDDNVLNLFHGFNITTLQRPNVKGDCSIILNHIRNIVGGDDKCYEWFINYLAHMFQKPQEIPGVCVVIKSVEGTGKGRLKDLLTFMIGENYTLSTSKFNQITGRFSSLYGKFGVFCEEMTGKDGFANSDAFKEIITEKVVSMELKGVDAYSIKNYGRYFVFSNNNVPVKVSSSDRRFVVFNPKHDDYITTEYFKVLSNSIDRLEDVFAFYDHLMGIDLSGYKPSINRPITEEYEEMKKATVAPIQIAMKHWLLEHKYGEHWKHIDFDDEDDIEPIDDFTNIIKVKSSVLFKDINKILINNGFKLEYNSKKFSMDMKANFKSITKVRTRACMCFTMSYKKVMDELEHVEV